MVIPGLNLVNLDGENGFTILGSESYSNGTVSTGDLNGDDFSDLIISTADSDEGRGKVYVVFGTEASFDPSFDLTSLDGNNGFTIPGIGEYNWLGEALASGGDLNGDGFDDLVIGAVSAGKTVSENDTEYSQEQGEVYVIFGTEAGFDTSFDLTSLNGDNGFTIPGINKNDRLGNLIDLAGDINGDGFDDLVVSGESNGKAYVIFGTEAGFDASFDLTSLDGNNGFTIPGINGMYALSSSSSHAGDLNGDGLSDLAISSFADEKIYVIFGTEAGFDANFDLTSLNGDNGFTIASSNQENRLGDAVSNAGDLNGDGLSDLIIGAPWSGETADENYGLGRGKAYVIFGTEDGFDANFDLNSLDGENGFAISGIDIDDNLGDAVSNAGDLDGDGLDDLIISAPSAEESIKLSNQQSDRQN
ncbi:MAG: integrin alpha, partial [Pleurocapsa sp.]